MLENGIYTHPVTILEKGIYNQLSCTILKTICITDSVMYTRKWPYI